MTNCNGLLLMFSFGKIHQIPGNFSAKIPSVKLLQSLPWKKFSIDYMARMPEKILVMRRYDLLSLEIFTPLYNPVTSVINSLLCNGCWHLILNETGICMRQRKTNAKIRDILCIVRLFLRNILKKPLNLKFTSILWVLAPPNRAYRV